MSSDDGGLLEAVLTAIRQVLKDTGREPQEGKPDTLLAAELGLDSLDLAQTIVLLERSLGIDPFRVAPPESGPPTIRTVADLVAIYARHGAGRVPAPPGGP